MDIEVNCLRRKVLKLLNSLFLSFFPLDTLQRIIHIERVVINTANGQHAALRVFESALWFYHEVKSIPKASFQQVLHCINCVVLFFFIPTSIYTHKILVYLFSLQLHQLISSSYKVIYYFYFYVILFSYPNQRFRPPIKAVYQVFCLERLQSQSSFSNVQGKVVTDVCFLCVCLYCSPNYLLFSSHVRASAYLKTSVK